MRMTSVTEAQRPMASPTRLGALLVGLTTAPVRCFGNQFAPTTPLQTGCLFLLGSFLYAVAGSLPALGRGELLPGAILLANALGMTLLSAAVTWLVVRALPFPPLGFGAVLKVFGLASAPVLLVAWVPGAFLFTEPWKWTLVALGLAHGLGIPQRRAVGIVLTAAGMTAAGLMLALNLLTAS